MRHQKSPAGLPAAIIIHVYTLTRHRQASEKLPTPPANAAQHAPACFRPRHHTVWAQSSTCSSMPESAAAPSTCTTRLWTMNQNTWATTFTISSMLRTRAMENRGKLLSTCPTCLQSVHQNIWAMSSRERRRASSGEVSWRQLCTASFFRCSVNTISDTSSVMITYGSPRPPSSSALHGQLLRTSINTISDTSSCQKRLH